MNVRLVVTLLVALVATQVHAQDKTGGRRGELKSLRDKASYSFGMTMAQNFKKQGIDVDMELMILGLRDATGKGKTLLTEEQSQEAMQAFEQELLAKQAEDSKKFLAENKKRPGVKTTADGLQYKIIKDGKGPKPKADDVVSVNYRASFVNGAEFETNGSQPFTTAVDQVIPGWQQALQMMSVGSKWLLFIPPELAYGAQGSPPTIAPNTTLVFELELVHIGKVEAPAKTDGAARPDASRKR
jgi:FKBP-type peptidyl-prolyl cis-trans isomerase